MRLAKLLGSTESAQPASRATVRPPVEVSTDDAQFPRRATSTSNSNYRSALGKEFVSGEAKGLVKEVEDGVEKYLAGTRVDGRGLANVLWALGRLQRKNERLMQLADTLISEALPSSYAVASPQTQATRRMTFNPFDLAVMLWAYSVLGHAHPRVLQLLGDEFASQVSRANAQDCGMVLLACG